MCAQKSWSYVNKTVFLEFPVFPLLDILFFLNKYYWCLDRWFVKAPWLCMISCFSNSCYTPVAIKAPWRSLQVSSIQASLLCILCLALASLAYPIASDRKGKGLLLPRPCSFYQFPSCAVWHWLAGVSSFVPLKKNTASCTCCLSTYYLSYRLLFL